MIILVTQYVLVVVVAFFSFWLILGCFPLFLICIGLTMTYLGVVFYVFILLEFIELLKFRDVGFFIKLGKL